MIQIPAQLIRQYTTFIAHKGVPPGEQQYYVKWVRFYFYNCHKNNFRQKEHKSLSAFMKKLKEKKQSEKQRKQAHYAVTLYFELLFRAARQVINNSLQRENITSDQQAPTSKETFCQDNKQLGSIVTQTLEPAAAGKEVLMNSGDIISNYDSRVIN